MFEHRPRLVSICVVLATVGLLLPIRASAQAGNCLTWSNPGFTQGDTVGTRDYRINITSFPISGLTADEVEYSIHLALDSLADQAESAAFRRVGTTTLQDLPIDGLCPSQDNLVVVLNNPPASGQPAIGAYNGRCRDPDTGLATKFRIVTYRDQTPGGGGTPITWLVGDATGPGTDLVHNWKHEAIHSYNLQHPQNGEAAVIATSGSMQNQAPSGDYGNAARDLYEYDMKCLHEEVGKRNFTGAYLPHNSGSLGSEVVFSGQSRDAYKGTPGVSLQGLAGLSFATAYLDDDCGKWQEGTNENVARCPDTDPYNMTGSLHALWREDERVDRVFTQRWFAVEPSAYDFTGVHPIRQFRSSNGFQSQTSGNLRACLTSTGFLQCGFVQTLYSGKRAAVAYDSYVARTHFVWAHQNRNSDGASREIRIATGAANDDVLALPVMTGLQMAIPPVIACGGLFSAGSYDCVLAYVPQTNTEGDIVFRRFWSGSTSSGYAPVWDPTPYTLGFNAATANQMALWYHDSRYWLAIRPTRVTSTLFQNLDIYRSDDGANWNLHTILSNRSDLGPTAVSYYPEAENYLAIWRF